MDGRALRVLVVDDQDIVRESLCDTLEATGHEVCGDVGSGEEAVEQVARLHPDVVLMDINMPGMGGIEAARLIRELPEPAPVVFLTALSDREVAGKAAQSGGFGYLVKPVHTQQIGPMLQTAVQRFRELSTCETSEVPEAVARPALDQLIMRLRSAGLEAAASEFAAAVGKQTKARGVAVLLLGSGSAVPMVPAWWGEVPPAESPLWRAVEDAEGRPGEVAKGVPHAPILDAAGVPAGALILFGAAAHSDRLLKVYAAGLGEALAAARAQQPMAWRRWSQTALSQ